MKVLVTGANGFVGQALCRRLQAGGWQVFGAVRRDVALPPGVTARPVGDIGPDADWTGEDWRLALSGMTAVVHLAARVHVMRETAADPLAEFRRANRDGTLRLAEAAARHGVGRLLFMSTVKVMGEASGAHPFRDTDPPTPCDPYAIAKREAEDGLLRLPDGPAVTVLRPPLVYGPGVGGNFRSLLRLADRGWPLPLGSIRNRRSLISVDNLADAVASALAGPPVRWEAFLIRDGEDVSTPELFHRVAAALGRPARLLPVPPSWLSLAGKALGKGAAVDRLLGSLAVDDSGFRARFGWQPPQSLDAGLAATAQWFRAGR
ncbi:MAG: SDR family oxidoreductase [Telmatospirillum sp.]|nr:SDR family oxidoreductase [Telmatospirillum sp.]